MRAFAPKQPRHQHPSSIDNSSLLTAERNQANSLRAQEGLRLTGHPLDSATRALLESRFGHDFSQVRVHSDAQAAASAEALSARAYTRGNDVAFGAGRYGTSTHEGRSLLAHELAHVVQQRTRTTCFDVSEAFNVAAEAEADRAAAAAVRGERIPAISEKAIGAVQFAPDSRTTHTSQVDSRHAATDPIEDAYRPGNIGESRWGELVSSANSAYIDGDAAEAVRIYKVLYSDVAELAQADRVLDTSPDINQVKSPPSESKGLRPGLNFSLHNPPNAAGQTGFVNDRGEFGVKPAFELGELQARVAIVLYRVAFKPDKAMTLSILRHELMHAEHNMQALGAIDKWRTGRAGKRKENITPEASFVNWLRKKRTMPGNSTLDLDLIEGASTAGTKSGSANSEVLAHVEGFMTAFHLISPAAANVRHDVFLELLGVLSSDRGLRWAVADESVRIEALGRLQEYYCHALDQGHRESFETWANYQSAITRTDRFMLHGEITSGPFLDEMFATNPEEQSGALEEAKARAPTKREDFFQGLQEIFRGKCKGLGAPVSMRL
jgi:hypothetical protein